MATYRSKVIANTWMSFVNKKLASQDKSVAAGTSVVGQEVGVSDTGDKVIQFGDLFSKLKWFDLVDGGGIDPDPEPEPTPLPANVDITLAKGSRVTAYDTQGKVLFDYTAP